MTTDPHLDLFMTRAAKDEVLTPILHAMLYSPRFVGFTVPVEGWTPRAYDGKFHPSTHATWNLRQLYLYLTAPDLLEVERMPLTGVLAVTAGKFWHTFLQLLWMDNTIMIRDEVPIDVPELNMVGHTDGELSTGEDVEIKTINEFQVKTVIDEEVLKVKKYSYWCQTQDYLMARDLQLMRYFMLNPTYPFPTSEFVVKADRRYQAGRAETYRQAMALAEKYPDHQLALKHDLIPGCCTLKEAKACPTRAACPVGRKVMGI